MIVTKRVLYDLHDVILFKFNSFYYEFSIINATF